MTEDVGLPFNLGALDPLSSEAAVIPRLTRRSSPQLNYLGLIFLTDVLGTRK